MSQVRADELGLHLRGALTLETLAGVEAQFRQHLGADPRQALQVDLAELTRLDTAGAVFLRRLPQLARGAGKTLSLHALPPRLQGFFDLVELPAQPAPARPQPPFLERLGERLWEQGRQAAAFLYLMGDLSWATAAALFRRQGIRRGSFTDQAIAVGSQGLPIIALVLFLVGAVSALQASVQLQKFGSNIFVANLLAIGICSELGPLMTAIIVSGRSGSAIASEVATMKFTEELDGLRTMGLDPVRFVAVPKMWAMLLCVPLLTVTADFVGLVGGTLVSVLAFDLSPVTFTDKLLDVLKLKHILTGIVKSLSFAWIITLIGVYRGLRFEGGAEGVGRATTAAVVSSLFGIIALDSFWGIVFYLKR